jgi:hypothetical protein
MLHHVALRLQRHFGGDRPRARDREPSLLRAAPRVGMRPVATAVAGALAMVFASTALLVAAYHAPRAKGLDVAVVGSPAQAALVASRLDAAAPEAFDVRRYATAASARTALLDTRVHGVLTVDATGVHAVVAGASGAAPTAVVVTAARGLARAGHAPLRVDDATPLPAADRRGLSPLFTVVGTLIPSLVFGALLSAVGRGAPVRIRCAAVLLYGVLAGLVVALSVDVVVGALTGHLLGIAVVTGLLALAVAAAAHGLGRLGGRPGIALAVLVMLLLGLSSSGGALTYPLEPGFYGAISQLLPPGAALTAVRNVVYFDWAATGAPLLVLAAWAIGGLVLALLGERFGPHAASAGAA